MVCRQKNGVSRPYHGGWRMESCSGIQNKRVKSHSQVGIAPKKWPLVAQIRGFIKVLKTPQDRRNLLFFVSFLLFSSPVFSSLLCSALLFSFPLFSALSLLFSSCSFGSIFLSSWTPFRPFLGAPGLVFAPQEAPTTTQEGRRRRGRIRRAFGPERVR